MIAPWESWRLIFEGKEYQPIHKNIKEWKDNYMKKGFTLIELLVVFTIIITVASTIIVAVNNRGNVELNPILMPRESQAQAQQKLAEEMAEQNRIMREMLKQTQQNGTLK